MELKEALAEIYKAAHKEFNFENTPSLHLRQDDENAQGIFGKTAYYDPSDMAVVLYITDRHPKDICRSFAHELVHHMQNMDDGLKDNSGEDGSPEENEANSLAAVIMRQYGRDNTNIYE